MLNIIASGFQFLPKPSVIKYIGPPCISPLLSLPLYIIDRVEVKNLVAIPTTALTHIQNIAPGPPTAIAKATPAMLPMPMVEVSLGSNLIIAAILVIFTSMIILGGLKRISNWASKMVPSMLILYFVLVLVILGINITEVPKYFMMIFTDAFAADYFPSDKPFLGGVLGALILHGIKRGAFSNEAGLGTAPMAHGATKTNEPVREGLVAMLGPVIDTLIVCTLTALAILVTDVWQTTSDNGVTLTAAAFQEAMPGFGQYLLMICVFFFSVSSLFSYAYYGTKCMSFLIGANRKHYYNYIYIASIVLAATTDFKAMINFIDGVFAFMAIPTMIATIILAPKAITEAKRYFNQLKQTKNEGK